MEMRGYFVGLDPFVNLFIEGSPEPVKALVDTGFNADLMLPGRLIRDLDLPEVGRAFYVTASGEEPETSVHVARLKWLGGTEEVLVLATDGEGALLGMGLLFDCSLAMEPSRGVLRIAR
jgi:clan AA aspartic protease